MALMAARQLLGEPFYAEDDLLIYNLDCVTAMERLGSTGWCNVDLCVTSPPYNIGKEYETALTTNQYQEWSRRWIRSVYEVTKPAGAFWLNLGYQKLEGCARAIPIPYLIWDKIDFYLVQEIVWHYGAGVACRNAFSPRNEKLLWYVKDSSEYTFNLDAVRDPNVKYPNQTRNGRLRCNPLGKNPSDVWDFPKVTSGSGRASSERTSHPAQFPTAVIDRVLKACSNSGDVVLDPFLGSGTTAEVSKSLGRQFIGFEIRPDYCEIAAKRVSGSSTSS